MKIEYTELTCMVCSRIAKVPKGNMMPSYWLTINSIGSLYSNTEPKLNCPVCSIAYLEKVGEVIKKSINDSTHHSLPQLKNIIQITCDNENCRKCVIFDTLNPVCGPGPLRDWYTVKSAKNEGHYCSRHCMTQT